MRHVYLGKPGRCGPDLPGTPPASPAGREPGPRPRAATLAIDPYVPGMSAEEVRERFGLDDVVKLASNENPSGLRPRRWPACRRRLADCTSTPTAAPAADGRSASRFELPEDHFIVGNGSDGVIKLMAETYSGAGRRHRLRPAHLQPVRLRRGADGRPRSTVPLTPDMRHDLPRHGPAHRPPHEGGLRLQSQQPHRHVVTQAEFDRLSRPLPRARAGGGRRGVRGVHRRTARLFGVDAVRHGDPRVVVLRTFSKIYGLAGLRVGYGIAPAAVVAELQRVKEPFQVNAPAQLAPRRRWATRSTSGAAWQVNEEGKRYFYRRLEELGLDYVPDRSQLRLFRRRPFPAGRCLCSCSAKASSCARGTPSGRPRLSGPPSAPATKTSAFSTPWRVFCDGQRPGRRGRHGGHQKGEAAR